MKRRNEAKLPETILKSSRIEATKEIKKKPPTKPELLIEFKALKEKHGDRMKENSKNLDTIENLRKELIMLKKQGASATVPKVDIYTETEECNQQCNECEFPANDIFELGEHIYEFHTQKAHGKFACTFCGDRFWTKDDLMLHRKNDHEEKVSKCINFVKQQCR